MESASDELVAKLAEWNPLAGDLMAAIAGSIAMDWNPKLALIRLVAQTGVAMRNEKIRQAREPTVLRPLNEYDEPGWFDHSDPELHAIMQPEYRETAEYHYAMAARERALGEGGE